MNVQFVDKCLKFVTSIDYENINEDRRIETYKCHESGNAVSTCSEILYPVSCHRLVHSKANRSSRSVSASGKRVHKLNRGADVDLKRNRCITGFSASFKRILLHLIVSNDKQEAAREWRTAHNEEL